MTLRTKLTQLKPAWGNEKLQIWDDSLLRKVSGFVTDMYVSESESVNVYSIVGTDNKDYLGKTWAELVSNDLATGSYIETFSLKHDVIYYPKIDVALGPSVYLVSLDGLRWYVHGEGIADVALARYDLVGGTQYTIHNVHKRDFRVDWTMFRYITTLESLIQNHNLPFSLYVQNVLKSENAYAGFVHKIFEIQVTLDRADGHIQNLSRIECELMIAELSKSNNAKSTLLKRIIGAVS